LTLRWANNILRMNAIETQFHSANHAETVCTSSPRIQERFVLPASLTFIAFVLLYVASPRRWALTSSTRRGGNRRSCQVGGGLLMIAAAMVWCRDLGLLGGLSAWLAAASAAGTLVILTAPLAPRAVVAATALASLLALVGGFRAWP
jgi:hypothetical protein